jgi:hypothetical protein
VRMHAACGCAFSHVSSRRSWQARAHARAAVAATAQRRGARQRSAAHGR